MPVSIVNHYKGDASCGIFAIKRAIQIKQRAGLELANYIDEEILCEAYTHLEIDIFQDKAKLAKLKHELAAFMEERAKFFFLGDDVRVKVEFEEGSLKTRVIVLGAAASTLVAGISAYGSFRSGVDQISKDATMLAQSANQELIFRTRTAYCDRISIEKRKGVFGRVDALLGELDAVRLIVADPKLPTRSIDLREFNGASDKLVEWDSKADKLFGKLSAAETQGCIAAGLLEELERFPDAAPWEADLRKRSFRATLVESDPKRAADLAAAAAKYAAVIRSLRSKMEARVKLNAPRQA
ncbi:hypothetical protein B1M_14127 [Burkholderia sp. TJI49]|nr:hypothetical protein B1M_14127 [Burkholderia sp. TJI49]